MSDRPVDAVIEEVRRLVEAYISGRAVVGEVEDVLLCHEAGPLLALLAEIARLRRVEEAAQVALAHTAVLGEDWCDGKDTSHALYDVRDTLTVALTPAPDEEKRDGS